jgi:hypothetical protein
VSVLEKEIEKHLVKLVKQSKGLSYKWISTVSGVPDRIVFIAGKIFLVELKTETGRLSPRQELVFDDLGEQGFPVHILHSREDVEDFVNEATKP